MSARLPLAATALLILVSTDARADFKRDYESALKAIEDQNWSQAAADLDKAIADNPDSLERVRMYGMKFIPYLPYYHLGQARLGLGDCQGALEAWDTALAKGVIQSQGEFGELQRNRQICEAQVVDISAIAANATSSLEALSESIADLERLSKEPVLSDEWTAQQDWRSALEEGKSALTQMRTGLAAAEVDKDAKAIEAISERASDLRSRVQQATGAAGQRVATLKAREAQRLAEARGNARRDLVSNIASARAALDESAPDPLSRQLQQELQALIAQSDELGSSPPVQALSQINRSLSTKTREFRQAVQNYQAQQRAIADRTPPATLKQVADAYFAGRYDEAVELADPEDFSEERAQIQAHLFRAAARFNQYMLGGREPQNLLQQAQDDIRKIKQLDRGFSPYVSAFPPKFAELFEQTM